MLLGGLSFNVNSGEDKNIQSIPDTDVARGTTFGSFSDMILYAHLATFEQQEHGTVLPMPCIFQHSHRDSPLATLMQVA
jgi:hypothetical protein